MPSQRVIEQFCIDSMQDFHDDHDDDLIISSNPFNGAGSKVTSTQRPPQLAQAADKPALVEINDPTNPINIPPPTPSPPLDATTDNTKSFNRGWDSSSADIPSLQEKDIDWTSTAADIGDDDPIIDNHLNNSDAFSSISQLSNTSSTTVIATSPVPSLPVSPPKGWPCPSYDLSKPFPWFRLPREIRHKILGKLLVREDAIRPWFNEGSVYLSAHECGVEDIDTRVLYTGEKGKGWNRQWYEDATDVLYGGNIFELSEPRVARWWCERIGANLRKVKTVIVWLEGGCAKVPMGTISCSKVDNQYKTPNEYLWLKFLAYLRPRHALSHMHIDLHAFAHQSSSREPRWEDAGRWRQEIILCLMLYRGLTNVKIEGGYRFERDYNCVFREIERAMVLGHGKECAVEELVKKNILRDERAKRVGGRGYPFK